MKVAGERGRRMVMESSTTVTKASFMKAFGWMECQNVGPCLMLGEMAHQCLQNIRFQRYSVASDCYSHGSKLNYTTNYITLLT